jgi:hypothetical protein
MRHVLFSGIVGGLAAGIVLGLLLSAVVPSDMGLPHRALMEFLAEGLGLRSLVLAWLVTLAASALLGAIFAGLVRRSRDAGTVSSVALAFGLAVWVVVSAIAGPLLIGASPVTGLRNIMRVWPLVVGCLMFSLLFLSVLAFVFLTLRSRGERAPVAEARPLRRAA